MPSTIDVFLSIFPSCLLVFALCIWMSQVSCIASRFFTIWATREALDTPILGTYMLEYNNFFLYWSFYHYIVSFFIFLYSLCFKIYFVSYDYCYPQFLAIFICLKYLFPSAHFQSMCVLCPKVGLLYAGSFFFFIQPAILCLLLGAFSSLTFKVIIDRYVFITILNLNFSDWLCISLFLSFCFFFCGLICFSLYYACIFFLFGSCDSIVCFPLVVLQVWSTCHALILKASNILLIDKHFTSQRKSHDSFLSSKEEGRWNSTIVLEYLQPWWLTHSPQRNNNF